MFRANLELRNLELTFQLRKSKPIATSHARTHAHTKKSFQRHLGGKYQIYIYIYIYISVWNLYLEE